MTRKTPSSDPARPRRATGHRHGAPQAQGWDAATPQLLEPICATDELDEARALLEELAPLREHAARLEQENYWLIDQLTKTVAAP